MCSARALVGIGSAARFIHLQPLINSSSDSGHTCCHKIVKRFRPARMAQPAEPTHFADTRSAQLQIGQTSSSAEYYALQLAQGGPYLTGLAIEELFKTR